MECLPIYHWTGSSGKECNQIRLGGGEIQFVFSDAGRFSSKEIGELSDPSRDDDRSGGGARRKGILLRSQDHQFSGSPVRDDRPISFTLYFENRFSLTVFDRSEKYESFSIHPDGIYV